MLGQIITCFEIDDKLWSDIALRLQRILQTSACVYLFLNGKTSESFFCPDRCLEASMGGVCREASCLHVL
jgi:hypothetical protein